MLKTMWNIPAKVWREEAANDEDAHEPVASGSLADMVRAFDDYDDADAANLIIKCAGRDRPITWEEIRDLRHTDETAAAGRR